MGNRAPSANSLRFGNGDHSYQLQLAGGPATLHSRGRRVIQHSNGNMSEAWGLSYKVGDESTCEFNLSNTKNPPHFDESIDIVIIDDYTKFSLFGTVKKAEAGFIYVTRKLYYDEDIPFDSFITSATNASGGITETHGFVYGTRTRRGLMVWEEKKTSKDGKPYVATVVHYYVNSENGKEVGLSVAAKSIRVSENGHLDFTMDGPQEHPPGALLYMFGEVFRTRTWKAVHCPHCANYSLQRQRAEFGYSENEDSETDNAPLSGRRPNGGGLLVNDRSVFRGNNNANLHIGRLILGRLRGRQLY